MNASYPKTYAIVTNITIYGYRIGKDERRFTLEEWYGVRHYFGKRRFYHSTTEYEVVTDTGEKMILTYSDWMHGCGGRGRRKRMKVGIRVKMYKHPKDSRPWRYKFLGE